MGEFVGNNVVKFQVSCALHSLKITLKVAKKLNAHFSSAAMAHTFSRLAAMDTCYQKHHFCLSLILCCQEF